MKKKLLFTLLVAICSTAVIAQPTLTDANVVPSIGDNQLYYVADTNSVIDPTVGANVIFDYTMLRGYGMTQTQYIVNPASTPNGATYPTATYADTSDATATNTRYAQVFGTDSLNTIGLVANVQGFGTVVAEYSEDPEKMFAFPFNYGDNYVDNYSGDFTLLSQVTDAYGNATVNADAWGQLQLPNGVTIDSVMRVRTLEFLLTDTIFITFPIPLTINPVQVNGEIINYYKPSVSKFPLLSYIKGVIRQDGNVLDSNRTFISQYALPGVGIKDELFADDDVQLYPNPASNEMVTLTINTSDNMQVSVDVINQLGQQVGQIYNGEIATGLRRFDLNTANYSAGIYFVRVSSGNKISTKKLVIH